MMMIQKCGAVAAVVAAAAVSLTSPSPAHAQAAAHASHQSKIPAPSGVEAQQAADTTITIRSVGSDLEFVPATIGAKQGTRVRIRYVNNGTFPHNIVIVKSDNDIDPLGLAAFNAGSTGYVPVAMKDRMIAHSPLAPPGETVEFTFVVPAPGDYPFVCLYPGHYNMMLGTFRSLR